MVFSSIPAYLDPSNWQQQPPNHHQIGNSSSNQLISTPLPPQSVPQLGHVAQQQPVAATHMGGPAGAGSIRPGSMAERARLANIPVPETALKCPRCESTNTKFCYFNNYSLSQPRHFCKTCRRYWTRGGALRSVPVGGGCRRNKRTKSSSNSGSKSSPVSSSDRQTTSSNSTSTTISSNPSAGAHHLVGLTPPHIPPLRFLSPLSQLTHHDHNFMMSTSPAAGDIGLSNYSGNISGPVVGGEMGFQLGSNLLEQWRMQQQLVQQFPFLGGGLDTPSSSSGLNYPFQVSGLEPGSGSGYISELSSHDDDQVRPKLLSSASMQLLTQMAAVKVEENQAQHRDQLNLCRQQMNMGINPNSSAATTTAHDHQWSSTSAAATAWTTDLTSFSSSSTTNPL